MGHIGPVHGESAEEHVNSTPDYFFQKVSVPIGFGSSTDPILQRSYCSYLESEGSLEAKRAEKLDVLRDYDVPEIETAVAICFWGRSGSFLLASYLDDHDDILMLPMVTGEAIYPFFHEYEALSLWEKLVVYPTYGEIKHGPHVSFFKADVAIAAADYYAAIRALFEAYGDMPAAWLDARPRFLQFLHVAYAVAIGRHPGSSRPIIMYAQHWTNDELAKCFVEDFPTGRFIHTIRDPISSFDSWFDRVLEMRTLHDRPSGPESKYLTPGLDTVRELVSWDRAHRGMETRTRAIRFEDLHLAQEPTMRRLADWLGIAFRPSMLKSTWNGNPYVVEIRGVPSCGPNPVNARRRSKNLYLVDRMLVFALLHENFVAWNYPCPSAMRRRWIRQLTVALIWLVPMKMELTAARWTLRLQAFPGLRNGRIGFACRAPIFLLECRLRTMLLIAREMRARARGNRQLLRIL